MKTLAISSHFLKGLTVVIKNPFFHIFTVSRSIFREFRITSHIAILNETKKVQSNPLKERTPISILDAQRVKVETFIFIKFMHPDVSTKMRTHGETHTSVWRAIWVHFPWDRSRNISSLPVHEVKRRRVEDKQVQRWRTVSPALSSLIVTSDPSHLLKSSRETCAGCCLALRKLYEQDIHIS